MNQQSLQYWFDLNAVNGVGWATIQKLLTRLGSIEAIFQSSQKTYRDSELSDKLFLAIQQVAKTDLSSTLNWLEQSDVNQVITPDSDAYPRLLKESPGAPVILFAKGRLELLSEPQLAIVGTRNPTRSGRESTIEFTRTLSQQGLCITSGLATGIDGMAHQAALDAGGNTIAVAGTGLDRVYPARHQSLAHDIVERGLIVSEYPLGTPIRGSNFPRRNRIISGLSLAVFVVEAALKSGSLITAQYALEQGRDVFAMPGSIHNTLAKGCHALIKQGAYLAENALDILQQLGYIYQAQQQTAAKSEQPDLALLPEQRELLNLIDFYSTSMDEIVERSKKSVADLSSKLLTLELDGWITSVRGGYQRQK